MAENYNATCPVCGKKFKVCRTCRDLGLGSWKTVTDSIDCFKVYIILHEYNVLHTLSKEEAKEKIAEFDLSGLKEYPKEIQKLINEINGIEIKEEVETEKVKAPEKTTEVVEKSEVKKVESKQVFNNKYAKTVKK